MLPTFFFLGASARPNMTAWCLRSPLALKMISSLIPPSSVGVHVTVKQNEDSGCKNRIELGTESLLQSMQKLRLLSYLNGKRGAIHGKPFIGGDFFHRNFSFSVFCRILNLQNCRSACSQLYGSKSQKRGL